MPEHAFFQPGHTYLRPTPHGTQRRFQALAVGTPPDGFAHPQEGAQVAFGWSQRITLDGNSEPIGSDYESDFTGWTLDPDAEVVPPQLMYEATFDSMLLGTYATQVAARSHCEGDARNHLSDGDAVTFDWIGDDSEPLDPWELTQAYGDYTETTSYAVQARPVLAAYDPEAES